MQDDQPHEQTGEIFGHLADVLPYDQPVYRRTVHTRPVTFTCQGCGRTVTALKQGTSILMMCDGQAGMVTVPYGGETAQCNRLARCTCMGRARKSRVRLARLWRRCRGSAARLE